jgi:nucleoside 2-deoxyribosyltransferase
MEKCEVKRWLPLVSRKPTIYVAAALSHAPEAFRDHIIAFKDRLRPYVEVLDFLGLGAPSAQEAFEWDMNCVRKCAAFVADVTYASIGVGVEFGVAYSLRKPIITVADADASVSRFVFGHVDSRHFSLRYTNSDEAVDFVLSTLRKLFPRM